MIFFHHFNFMPNEGGIFDAGGDCGVAFFFILSGFVLAHAYKGRTVIGQPSTTKRGEYMRFIIRRLSKIYPLHLICLLAAIILKLSLFAAVVSNVFLLQAWIPLSGWYFSGNAVGWCLSDFLFFYAMFPLLNKQFTNNRRRFILTFIVLTIVYSFSAYFIPSNFVDGIMYINPFTRILDFTFGMVLFGIYDTIDRKKLQLNVVDVLFWLSLSIAMWYLFPSRYNLSLLWWPSIALLILYSTIKQNRLLALRPLVEFGDVSFSFYLIHVLAIQYIDLLFEKTGIPDINPFIRLTVIFTVVVAVSFLIHRGFVIPIEKYIRKRI